MVSEDFTSAVVAAKGARAWRAVFVFWVRGLPLSTSAPRGEGVHKLADFEDEQRCKNADEGEGVQNPEHFVDVLNGSSLSLRKKLVS